jgi:RimJ/RimL family protein N-acetyltransferase
MVRSSTLPSGVTMRALTDAELLQLADDPDFGYSARKLETLGRSSAYGVWVAGRLAHLAWMIDAEQDARQSVRNVKLRAGEREITHCVTARAFRGRGLYPVAIAQLCAQAAQDGTNRIIMITGSDNASSRRGIEKAGLPRCGALVRLFLRRWPAHSITWRGHRF